MAEFENSVRLTGGLFFDIILSARPQRIKARETIQGNSDGLSDPAILAALMKVWIPEYANPYQGTFKANTTLYKQGKLDHNIYLPFDNADKTKAFDAEIKNNYSAPLKRMHNFISKYIDVGLEEQVCRDLLSVINADEDIDDDDDLLYVDPDGGFTECGSLFYKDFHHVDSLLLGIWHYIIMNRPNNKEGKDTIDSYLAGTAVWMQSDYLSSNRINVARTFRRFTDEEIDAFGERFVVESKRPAISGNYAEYLLKATEKYSSLKTLLYNDEPHNFYDFYVCNHVFQGGSVSSEGEEAPVSHHIEDLNLDKILSCSHFVMLTGTGGLGKSMMMRHLLLSTIDNFDRLQRIPVFIPLKDYGRSEKEFEDIIFESLHRLSDKVNRKAIIKDLESGNFLLLFDGLDEINTLLRTDFESKLDNFIDTYSSNVYVLSSRPFNAFIYLSRFSVMQLCQFNKKQALTLIDKLDFRPDEPQIKEKFKAELKSRLYETHHEFACNPLLLTIMLMTYEQYAEVPSKMHIFYQEAYATLSQKHDASKGAYKRALKTGLTADRFQDYFAEFCAKTYLNEKYELTRNEIETYYNELKTKEKDQLTATASDFITDLTSNMCLMYYEDSKYHFTHRSFQEYFCALCFSRWKDKKLWFVGQYFEEHDEQIIDDMTFNMLYDMIPEKVEEYIFLPFLEELIKKCDDNDGYWTFLETIYPEISYLDNAAEEKYPQGNINTSFIYDFIISKDGVGIGENTRYLELPYYEAFKESELIELEGFKNLTRHAAVFARELNQSEVEEFENNDFFKRFGKPEHFAWVLTFNVANVRKEPKKYEKLLDALNADMFPMKMEYNSVRQYYLKLKEQQKMDNNDIFSLF